MPYQYRNLIKVITLFIILSFILAGCKKQSEITMYDGKWESIRVNNAIAGYIIEKGYGYKVKSIELTEPLLKRALTNGDIDINMEMWKQNMQDWYTELINKKIIVNLGMTFKHGPQFWIIPQWVADKYKIKTVFDMKKHWRLFSSGDNSRGLFYNCIVGWECAEINRVKLEAYKLDKYFKIINPGSIDALEAAFERAQKKKQPIFGFFWAPTPLIGSYKWHILKEPAFEVKCWDKIFQAIRDKNKRPTAKGCAYEDLPVEKVVHIKIVKRAPEIVKMLKKFSIDLEHLNTMSSWVKNHKVKDPEKIAKYFFKTNKSYLKKWVPVDIYNKITKSLNSNDKK